MFDFESSERKHSPEPDLVPIMDALTAVIFFMLLSITFVGITKITIPPSFVSTASINNNETPLSPIVKARLQGSGIIVKLEWLGRKPGAMEEKANRVEASSKNVSLIEAAQKLSEKFKDRFPDEKSLQIALDADLNYQELISIMDGLRKNYEDLVLSSYVQSE